MISEVHPWATSVARGWRRAKGTSKQKLENNNFKNGGKKAKKLQKQTKKSGCKLWRRLARWPAKRGGGQDQTVSSMPTMAVAVFGTAYGARKPVAAACGADVMPISTAAQLAQPRPR